MTGADRMILIIDADRETGGYLSKPLMAPLPKISKISTLRQKCSLNTFQIFLESIPQIVCSSYAIDSDSYNEQKKTFKLGFKV